MGKKRRKPIWLRIIIWLLSSILSIAALLAVVCGFLYIRYQINVFKVIKQIKIINQTVDVNSIAPNQYSPEDLTTIDTSMNNAGLTDVIVYDSETGKYSVNQNVVGTFTAEIKISDKQVGAIIDNIVESQEEIKVKFGKEVNLKDYGFKVVQIQFSNIQENSVDFNVVIKLELKKVKEKMTSFPKNWIAKYIPKDLYISSTVTINYGTTPFGYTTVGKSMRINNLTEKETAELLKTADALLKIGSAETFGKTIGDTFVNLLIGTEDQKGFAYYLKDNGADDFKFEIDGTTNNFVIEKQLLYHN